MTADRANPATQRRSNVRTAWVLASIAIVFFFGIMVSQFIGDSRTGTMVLGAAVMLFLILAIGRNLRR